jgi:thiol-disulfide isomerase/thioredoxin
LILALAVGCERAGRSVAAGGQGRAPASVPKVPVESALTKPAEVPVAADAAVPANERMVVLNTVGVRRRLRDAVGRPLLVHVWASWCAPCLQELPSFDALAERARARGVEILALAVDTEYRDVARVADVLRARAPHLAPVIADHGGSPEFFALFSPTWRGTIPATFVFARNGKVHRAFPVFADPKKLEAALDEVLSAPAPRGRP